jgi:DnaJ like chaperone protein
MFGKLIGALLGFLALGWFGLLLGVVAGHFFDKALAANFIMPSGAEQQQLREQFFRSVFVLMGRLAKADGRISEQEIQAAEGLMQRMGLTLEHRQQAIELFKQGASNETLIDGLLKEFASGAGRYPQLRITLLEYLTVIALADGELHDAERAVLFTVANSLGIPRRQFEHLLSMLLAQEQFREQQFRQQQYDQGDARGNYSQQDYSHYQRAAPRRDELQLAYQALGVNQNASDGEVKKAWRKLMSQHHPDKLIAQGVPDDMLKIATEKTQEIQSAYELICKARGIA